MYRACKPQPLFAGAVIYALDIVSVSEFYAGLTGLPIVTSEAEHVVLAEHGFELTVVLIRPEFAENINIQVPPVRRTETPVKLVFAVPSIEAARRAARQLGGDVEGVEHEWSLHDYIACDGHDPEGNIFQLRQHT